MIYYARTVNGQLVMGGVDENGNPVENSKEEHPYSYDSFVLWGDTTGKRYPTSNCLYSDRIRQWDYEKYEEVCKRHFGREVGYWADIEIPQIEAFLRDLLDRPKLTLYRLMEGCNPAYGNPLWMFFYHEEA